MNILDFFYLYKKLLDFKVNLNWKLCKCIKNFQTNLYIWHINHILIKLLYNYSYKYIYSCRRVFHF